MKLLFIFYILSLIFIQIVPSDSESVRLPEVFETGLSEGCKKEILLGFEGIQIAAQVTQVSVTKIVVVIPKVIGCLFSPSTFFDCATYPVMDLLSIPFEIIVGYFQAIHLMSSGIYWGIFKCIFGVEIAGLLS